MENCNRINKLFKKIHAHTHNIIQSHTHIWVCLKMGYIPNEIAIYIIGIMISKTIGFRGTNHWVYRNPQVWFCPGALAHRPCSNSKMPAAWVRSNFGVVSNKQPGLSWRYHCFIMALSLLYHGFIMALSWFYHGFIIVLSWFYQGFIRVLSWYFHVFIMVLSWCYHGVIMVLSWLYHDFIMVLSWLFHCFIMVLSLFYHGFIMVL